MSVMMKYTSGDLVVNWRPRLCEHSGTCRRLLPEVFNPNAKPWVNMDAATFEKIKEIIDQCPSGALSYDEKSRKMPVYTRTESC